MHNLGKKTDKPMPRHAISAFAISLAALCFHASQAYAAACAGTFRFVGPQTELEGKTKKNVPCTIAYGLRSDINGYQVVAKPAHGTVGSAGYQGSRLLTAYKPEADYSGTDDFTLSIDYTPRRTGVAKTTELHVHMTVAP
jgi:hypothetical protein